MKRGRRRERTGVRWLRHQMILLLRQQEPWGVCELGEKWVLDPSGVGEAGQMKESWKERPRDWLV